MFSPEEQQIEICLLKSNLEKIGDDLVVQNSALPALDAENERKYRDTMTALRLARSLNAERERLNQENVRLTAKRMQLKRQCEDITSSLERVRGSRNDLVNSLKREEQEMELLIRHYEDSLHEKADRFRKTRSYYDENAINHEIEKVDHVAKELEREMNNMRCTVEDLKNQLEVLKPDVPDNILEIMGKSQFDEKVKSLVIEYEKLYERRKFSNF